MAAVLPPDRARGMALNQMAPDRELESGLESGDEARLA
jgi:hypothetical protein